ncbi:hypothetical protein HanPSC8_Chr04g0145471 [Helianthus annuus]|nr:hypothetical protein HanPSC8_Chr04g0145471 [Helianthus annuus]
MCDRTVLIASGCFVGNSVGVLILGLIFGDFDVRLVEDCVLEWRCGLVRLSVFVRVYVCFVLKFDSKFCSSRCFCWLDVISCSAVGYCDNYVFCFLFWFHENHNINTL